MTMQYLSGEVSVWLEDLARLATDGRDANRVKELRIRAECCALQELGGLIVEVLDAIDRMCWRSLFTGHVVAFNCQVAAARDFAEFARAAQLVRDV